MLEDQARCSAQQPLMAIVLGDGREASIDAISVAIADRVATS